MAYYIVVGSQDDWNCSHTWNEKLFAKKEKAEEYIKTENEKIQKQEDKLEKCRLCPLSSNIDPEELSEEDISEINLMCDVNTNPNSEYKDKENYCKISADWNIYDTVHPMTIQEIELSE